MQLWLCPWLCPTAIGCGPSSSTGMLGHPTACPLLLYLLTPSEKPAHGFSALCCTLFPQNRCCSSAPFHCNEGGGREQVRSCRDLCLLQQPVPPLTGSGFLESCLVLWEVCAQADEELVHRCTSLAVRSLYLPAPQAVI